MLIALKAAGANGYCPKGTPVSELILAMEQVTGGNSYWASETQNFEEWESQRIGTTERQEGKTQ